MVKRKQASLLPIIIGFSIFTMSIAPAFGGSVSAGGWNASWDKSFDDVLGLTALSTGDDTVTFNKFAEFTKGPGDDGAYEPLVITFQQYAPSAKKWIRIGGESVINQSGLDWTGFRFVLAPPAANGVGFDAGKTFSSAGESFSIAPFATHALSDDSKQLTLAGGTVPHQPVGENVWNPGQASGSLWINTAPLANGGSRAFEFKEVPIDPPPTHATAVPLPMGLWSGLMVLGVMGVWKTRSARRVI